MIKSIKQFIKTIFGFHSFVSFAYAAHGPELFGGGICNDRTRSENKWCPINAIAIQSTRAIRSVSPLTV
jgi:hypothetical protein